MKKLIIIILVSWAFSPVINAQSYANAFVFNVGVIQDGIGATLNYNYFIDRHDFIVGSLLLTSSKYKYTSEINIPYNDFTFNVGYSKSVYYSDENTFNINLDAGVVFGYQTINNGNPVLSNGSIILSKPGFVYGGFLGVDLDYSISDQYSIVVKGTEFYHMNSTLGKLFPYIGVGIRFYSN